MSQGAGTTGTPSALQNGFNKVFIQRDYSEGTAVKFHTRLPSELEGLVSNFIIPYLCMNIIKTIFFFLRDRQNLV